MTSFAKRWGLIGLGAMIGCDTSPPGTKPAILPADRAHRMTPTYEANVGPTLRRFCVDCHRPAAKRGGVDLDDPRGRTGAETWTKVADVLRDGTMPPPNQPQPSIDERAAIVDWIEAEGSQCSASEAEPGRVTMRRLNRAEYDRTIRDLIGLDLHLADAFPADDVGDGFDHGDVLSTSPILIERYLQAAGLAIERAAGSPEAWARIMNPAPDAIPLALRKPTFAARNEPVKRIGRPTAPPAPPVEDPEALALRRSREILRGFADRAFRRPATAEELDRLAGLAESARQEGDGLDEAIRHALKAVLISPNFLFRVEEGPEPDVLDPAPPVGEFELASRLSYFLWSGPPDDELYRLAARGELRRGENLNIQARRMLQDARAHALVDGFAAQWLQVRSLREFTPDPARFPEFDEPLRRAMVEETLHLAAAVLLDNGRIWEFLDADHTFVNERLARHYGIPGVVGERFRRVSLAGTGRVGVMTHASVLAVTSNPTRTSPVKRGKWVLDNLLGTPPPPPPEGVEALNGEANDTRSGTLRQRTERHRSDPNCAACHARMDPVGFALENFNPIGAWRSADEGGPIDASAVLPGGEVLDGASGLRTALMNRRGEFARCLAEKLLTYALGRGLGGADRCAVDEIVRKLERGDGRATALIVAVVESPPFRHRSRSKETP